MKKIFLCAATALMGLAATAQTVVGLERPKTDDGYVAFTSTDAYLKTADGLQVGYYESDEMASRRTTSNTTSLIYHGNSASSDFGWTLKCNSTGFWESARDHAADAKFPEGFTFGFDVTVPEGKTFDVSSVTLDLLFNANPTWRVRIADAEGTELYNSGNMEKFGSLRGYLSCGGYAKITSTEFSMTYVTDPNAGLNADNAEDKVAEALADNFQLLPADLKLEAGKYTVMLDFDFYADGSKVLSFDSFTIEGQLADAAVAGSASWNFSEWETATFTETFTKDGLTIAATADATVVIDANNKTVNDVKYTQRLKLGGTGKAESRNLSFAVPGSCKIDVVLMSASSSEDRTLNVATGQFDNVVGTMQALGESCTMQTYDYEGGATTVYLYSVKSGINIYAIYVTPTTVEPETVYSIIGTFEGEWDVDWDFTGANGHYELVKEDFLVKTTTEFEYKVRANHEWGGFELPAPGEGNYHLTLEPGYYKLVFTLNPDATDNLFDCTWEKTADYTPEQKTCTVYFVNAYDWSDVRVWAWRNDAEGQLVKNYTENLQWPGDPVGTTGMKVDGHDVYTWSITTTEDDMPTGIIFNGNGGANQTQDLDFEDGATYYPDGTVTVGINEVAGRASSAVVYNLRGQRVQQPVSGELYIQNGRKLIAK